MSALDFLQHQRRALIVASLAFSLLLGSCSSSSSTPPPPERNANAETPNFVGSWAVSATYTHATGDCASVVGQSESGTLTITQNGSSYTVTDGETTRPLTVTGNYATFRMSLLGVTQTWTFVVYHNDSLLHGQITTDVCTAEATVTGSRTGSARIVENEDLEVARSTVLVDESVDPAIVIVVDEQREVPRLDTHRAGLIVGVTERVIR